MKKILNIYIKSSDNERTIKDDCRDSIEIIGKTVLTSIIEKLNNYEINILGSHSNHNTVTCFANVLVLNVLTLCDFEFLKKFKNKIYFFDDLNLWKINNNIEYINNLIFDAYLTPLEENVDGLKSKLKNVIYLPFSSSYSSIVANRHSKTLPISMFLDIWRNRGTETDRGEISLAKAVNFFNNIKYKNISIFVHEAFSRDIYGTNVKYISDMPKAQFHEFIKDMWFYATSIQSSYEFIVLESTLFGSLCIDIDNSVRVEHRKSRATIANEFFYSNYENIIENYSSDRNSCEAREIYCSGQYDAVFSAILK